MKKTDNQALSPYDRMERYHWSGRTEVQGQGQENRIRKALALCLKVCPSPSQPLMFFGLLLLKLSVAFFAK